MRERGSGNLREAGKNGTTAVMAERARIDRLSELELGALTG